jgi:hypothetical protein
MKHIFANIPCTKLMSGIYATRSPAWNLTIILTSLLLLRVYGPTDSKNMKYQDAGRQ